MLLQKLQGHDPIVDGPIMFALADLSAHADVASFGDILKGIFDVGRKSDDDEVSKAVSCSCLSVARKSCLIGVLRYPRL